jgi:MazG family protein
MERDDPALNQACRRLETLVRLLRAPEGCPWDRAQTLRSLAPYLIEETHELYEAITLGDRQRVAEEAGDTLFLLIFLLHVAEQEGWLMGSEMAERAEAKIVRRHPHVFGEGQAADGATPLGRWEQIKRLERPPDHDLIGPLPAGLPALARASRVQEKAAAFGFDWKEPQEVVPKLREEIEEVDEALISGSDPGRVQEEIGDLLFAVVNLARHLGQDPEATLHGATEKFRTRINAMARSVERAGHRMGETPLEVMESHWRAGKGDGKGRPEQTAPPQGDPDGPARGERQ